MARLTRRRTLHQPNKRGKLLVKWSGCNCLRYRKTKYLGKLKNKSNLQHKENNKLVSFLPAQYAGETCLKPQVNLNSQDDLRQNLPPF